MGLSPHIRGNADDQLRTSLPYRVYPRTYGGTGWISFGRVIPTWVYPRTYGGTAGSYDAEIKITGLSPHIRGNGSGQRRGAQNNGSIPAHTGERKYRPSPLSRLKVYPRTYGGTAPREICPSLSTGLSPHIRGNATCVDRVYPRTYGGTAYGPLTGSIPAHTGEREQGVYVGTCIWVYPRTYGGTLEQGVYVGILHLGLSPHIRGNVSNIVIFTCIPRVYPRTYGGTRLQP